MKKILLFFAAVCCMMVANAQTQPDNEIWYTSSDGSVVTPYEPSAFNVSIVTNEYDTEANKGCITFNGNVTSIGSNAFYNCVNLTSINLPSTLSSIGIQAFKSCTGLAEIDIPSSLMNFHNYAFEDCTGLTEINIPSNVTSIGNYVFDGCTGLTEINIPSNVTSIGQGALQGCTNLISVTLQNGLTSLPYFTFQYCTGLTEINIPSSVTSIGNFTFRGCKSLTEIIIPSSVTSIGNYAFYDCTGLTRMIVLAENPPQINSNTFPDVPAYIPVYVPDKDVYSGNESWSKFNFNFKNLDEDLYCYKQIALIEINNALIGVTLLDNETTAVNGHIQTINNVPDDAEATNENKAIVDNAKYAALAIINQVIIRNEREAALAAIQDAMQGETSAYLTGLVQEYIDIINGATDITTIIDARDTALVAINAAIGAYQAGKSEALGTLGTEQNGSAVEVIDQDDKSVILYNPKKVNFIKVSTEE